MMGGPELKEFINSPFMVTFWIRLVDLLFQLEPRRPRKEDEIQGIPKMASCKVFFLILRMKLGPPSSYEAGTFDPWPALMTLRAETYLILLGCPSSLTAYQLPEKPCPSDFLSYITFLSLCLICSRPLISNRRWQFRA